jgi:multimeric flavodoxin WrbA
LNRIVLLGAEQEGAYTEAIYLPGKTVLPCLGCDYCHKEGRCTQKDDFAAIQQKILAADGVVLGSPNYIFSISARRRRLMEYRRQEWPYEYAYWQNHWGLE